MCHARTKRLSNRAGSGHGSAPAPPGSSFERHLSRRGRSGIRSGATQRVFRCSLQAVSDTCLHHGLHQVACLVCVEVRAHVHSEELEVFVGLKDHPDGGTVYAQRRRFLLLLLRGGAEELACHPADPCSPTKLGLALLFGVPHHRSAS
eukprot:tig00000448_g892.t1